MCQFVLRCPSGPGAFLLRRAFMKKKIFKSYRQILSILRSRGVDIKKGSAGSRAIKVIEKENYYNVVNGYKSLFIQTPATTTSDEAYKPGVTFDEIYALYDFDRELRIIYLKYLLKLENHFKTVVSHIFSQEYGFDNYLKLANFYCGPSVENNVIKRIAAQNKLDINKDRNLIDKLSTAENVANVTRLIGDIQQEIARQLNKHHEMVSHYMTIHGYIPLWVLVNVLTFGKVTTFYLNMKETDKIKVAKQFGVPYKELHKYMDMLGFARNKCAHDERFFNIRFTKYLHAKSIPNFSVLSLPRDKSGTYIKGTADAYAIAIIFRRLLSKTDFNEFKSAMESIIKKLSKQLHTIPVDDVLSVMGYTSSWRNITKL